MNQLKNFTFDKVPVKWIQIGCLVMVGLIEIFSILFGSYMGQSFMLFAVMGFNISASLYLGVSISHPMTRSARNLLLLGLAFVAWTGMLQLLDLLHYSPTGYAPRLAMYTFLCEYVMMLSYGSIADEKEKDTGLKVFGGCYLFAAVLLSLLALALLQGIVPESLKMIMKWLGNRLSLMWHPNVLAPILMIGMGLSLAFAFRARKIWAKALLTVLSIVFFLLTILTNSRTVVIMSCCLLAGIVFVFIYKRNLKSFLIGLVTAAVVFVAVFSASDHIYDLHCDYRIQSSGLSRDVLQKESGQRELTSDMHSLNGRTGIWKATLQCIAEHPQVLLIGTAEVGKAISPYNSFEVQHAHNSWLQTLAGLGLVGFILALYISWLAVKNCFILIFLRDSSMFHKSICILVIAIMGAECMENCLFYVEFPCNFIQIPYMLLVGYLVYWNTLPAMETAQCLQETGNPA